MKNKNLIFDDSREIRAIYSRAACLYKFYPKGVFFPQEEADFSYILDYAKKMELPLTMRGGGSGLAGQSVGEGLIVDHSRFLKKIEMKDNFEVITSMGVVLSELNRVLSNHKLFFPPDPSSSDFCTIGGMIGNNSKGARSVKYGTTLHYLNWLEVLLYDGTILKMENKEIFPSDYPTEPLRKVARIIDNNRNRILKGFPQSKANASGYNLKECLGENGKINLLPLFVGSEGTLGIFLKASLKVKKFPQGRSLAIAEFPSLEDAVSATLEIIPFNPSALELLDKSFIEIVRRDKTVDFPIEISQDCKAILIVETDGMDNDESELLINKIIKSVSSGNNFKKAETPLEKNRIWSFRKSASPLLNRGRGKLKSIRIIEDGAVPTKNIPNYVEGVKQILGREDIEVVMFGHAGDGNFHINPFMDLTDRKHFDAVPKIVEETAILLKNLEGTISGEHGDGRLRAPYLRIIYGDLCDLFLKIKEILDPQSLFNPGVKITRKPEPLTNHFKYSPDYKRIPLKNELSTDEWETEMERCHGCGNCRDFCPTAKATNYDPLSSRGRAHFLQSILDGTIDEKSLKSAKALRIFESCLNCKECLTNCPTKVDISPISTLILKNYSTPAKKIKDSIYASFSSMPYKVPKPLFKMANGVLNSKFVRFFGEKFLDFRSDLKIEIKDTDFAFDPQKLYFFEGNKDKVILFYGCFGNIYNKEGETLLAVKILQKLGVKVVVPPQGCCGISKISRGLFDLATEDIVFTQKNFVRYIEDGYKVVYTAPSCGVALKNEHPQFFSSDNSSLIAENTIYLSEFLLNLLKKESYRLKELNSSFVYQTPCHSMVFDCDKSDIELLSMVPSLKFAGKTINCCGIAGTIGFKKENIEISTNLAETLKKEIEGFNADYIVTPCGSCKIQVENLTSKRVIHPLELFAKSLGL